MVGWVAFRCLTTSMTRPVGFISLTVAPWTGTLLAPRVISSLTALDTCCSAPPARYRVRIDAISRFTKTSRSLPWRVVKLAVAQMPCVLELDRVSDQHDVACYWHVSQRSRTRFSHTRRAAQSAVGWR
jgi:hypothetical protein